MPKKKARKRLYKPMPKAQVTRRIRKKKRNKYYG